MPTPDPDKIRAKCDRDGSEEVKKKLARKAYAPFKVKIVEDWLREKEQQSDELEPKPPEIVQKIKWIILHWRKYWKYLIIGAIVLLIPFTKGIVDFYRSNSDKHSTETIQQSMVETQDSSQVRDQTTVNSPGSIQAGGDVNIENVNINIQNNTTFISPSNTIRKNTKDSLIHLKKQYSSNFPQILLVVRKGNEARESIASTLDEMLRNIEMGHLYKWRTITFKKPPPPLVITYNQENKSFAGEVISSLAYYIQGKYSHSQLSDYPIDKIEISLYGIPFFEKDGRVKIE